MSPAPHRAAATGPEVIYIDGSGRGNGKPDSVAGVGVYFGPDDPRNLSEPLPGEVQTNQRAEITAAIRALETADSSRPLEIHSDSKYTINAAQSWIKNWKSTSWRRSDGQQVMNKDLFRKLDRLLEDRPQPVEFKHVRAHTGVPGNEAANQLAFDAATQAMQKPRDTSSS